MALFNNDVAAAIMYHINRKQINNQVMHYYSTHWAFFNKIHKNMTELTFF